MRVLHYRNQGQKIAAGWDAPVVREWTSLFGTDGERFAPPLDRDGYSPGVARRLGSGGVAYAGFPVVRLKFPWISDGQIEYLKQTIGAGSESANVTADVHTPMSVGPNDVSRYNAIMNMNLEQLPTLSRRANGYEQYILELVLVEAL